MVAPAQSTNIFTARNQRGERFMIQSSIVVTGS